MSVWLGTIAEGKFSPLLCIMVPLPIILSYQFSCLFGSPTAASGVKKNPLDVVQETPKNCYKNVILSVAEGRNASICTVIILTTCNLE